MTGAVLLAVLDPLVGALLLIMGGVLRRRRPATGSGNLLLLAGACWYAGAVVPSLVALHRGPLIHLLLTYPSGRTRSPVILVAVVLGWLAAIAGGITAGPWATLAAGALLGVIGTVRAAQAAAGRRHSVPAAIGALAYSAALLIAGVNVLADLDADLAVAVIYDAVVALVILGVGASLMKTQPVEHTAADVVTGLGPHEPGLTSQLRRVLDDPTLAIGRWSPESGGYLGEDGHVIQPTDEQASTRVTDEDPPTLLFHRRDVLADPGLLEGASAAVRLSLANDALRRQALDRLTRLAEARRRIVEAADAEARDLSRELLDGPELRLRDVSRSLSESEALGSADPTRLEAVRRGLAAAHHELQQLAHGVRPPQLAEGGLACALPALAAAGPLPADVHVEVDRLDPTIEAGVYFFCAEGLTNAAKHAAASRVRVTIRTEPGLIVAEVADNGRGGADPQGSGLRGLKDRIEALGGTLEISPGDRQGARLVARIPTQEEAPQ